MKDPEHTILMSGGDMPQDHFVEVEVIGQVDRYSILQRLGAGAFGEVLLAYDTVAQIQVALKGLPREATRINEILERTRRNFTIVSRLSHPNIVTVRHLHKAEVVDEDASEFLNIKRGDYVLVMDYVDGETLTQLMARYPTRRLPLSFGISICHQVAAALDYAHSRKVIHRDIKPGNVMVDKGGNVRVLDFGLAADVRDSAASFSQELNRVCGTRRYMAPEQWNGETQGPATDQYSLAILLYELLNGSVPHSDIFESSDHDFMYEVVSTRKIPRLKRLNRQQNQMLFRALERDQTKRFPTCQQFIESLEAATGDFHFGRFALALAGSILLLLVIGGALASVDAPDAIHEFSRAYLPASREEPKLPKRADVPDELIEARSRAIVAMEKLAELDPGQGMEAKITELRQLMKAAEGYAANERFTQAGERYRQLCDGCVEIELLEHDRISARTAKSAMEAAKKKAWEAETFSYAKQLWKEGTGRAEAGLALYEKGDFEKALKVFDETKIIFERALEAAQYHRGANEAQASWLKALAIADREQLKAYGEKEWEAVELVAGIAQEEYEDGLFKSAAKSFAKARKQLSAAALVANDRQREHELRQKVMKEIRALTEILKSIQTGTDLNVVVRRRQLELLCDQLRALCDAAATPADLRKQLGELLAEAKHEAKSLDKGPRELFPWKVNVTTAAPMEFAYVPSGSFFMGSTAEERAKTKEATGREPTNEGDRPRLVKVERGFWMAKTEVTVAHFQAFVKDTKHKTTAEKLGWGTVQDPIDGKWQNQAGYNWKNPGYPYKIQLDFPVTFVSWIDATTFCQWLTARERKADRLPTNLEYRLPTEAEWEYACRAAPQTRTVFWWGDKQEDAINRANVRDLTPLDEDANIVWKRSAGWKDGWSHVASVDYFGKQGRNVFEMADMTGNVAEWTISAYEEREAPEVYVESDNAWRTVRGGSFLSMPIELRSAARVGMEASSARQDLGFRIVCAHVLDPEE